MIVSENTVRFKGDPGRLEKKKNLVQFQYQSGLYRWKVQSLVVNQGSGPSRTGVRTCPNVSFTQVTFPHPYGPCVSYRIVYRSPVLRTV